MARPEQHADRERVQNIVNVLSVKDNRRYSFYFVPGSEKLQYITLQ